MGHLYKLAKHLAPAVAGRSQEGVLRKSTSLKDKRAHAFCGWNNHTEMLQGVKAAATTIVKATKCPHLGRVGVLQLCPHSHTHTLAGTVGVFYSHGQNKADWIL